jgi:general nucleoside transport system ATP-binding protein
MSIAIELVSVTKRFGSVVANDHVDLRVESGTIHALLGENGAGKTTLMNVLYGLVRPEEGEIRVQGQQVDFKSPSDAIAARVGMVHQHFMIAPSLTVAQNILIGRAPSRFGLVNTRAANRMVSERAKEFGFDLDPRAKARDLSIGELQRVEIVKALIRGAEVLILDEPTAVLTPQEADDLSRTLRTLANQGTTVVLITHKLREVTNTCDRATVMRNGRVVGTVEVQATDEAQLTQMMVGRIPINSWAKSAVESRPLLDVRALTVRDDRGHESVSAVSFAVPAGRIIGIAGVEGNGQTQLVEALTGLRKIESGTVTLDGEDVTNSKPRTIRGLGVAHIPEDRLRRGVARSLSIKDNLLINVYRQAPHSRFRMMHPRRSDAYARTLIERFSIATDNPASPIGGLSGGNMQKVVVARELATAPNLVIAAQPTRGVDVGSIEFLHREIVELRDEGVAVLLISAELDELLALSDVIHVMYEGSIVATFDPTSASEYDIGAAMAGSGSTHGSKPGPTS